ncbi:helicase-related protein [Streptomyces sp. NBC_00140]|uniref:helicase-related protein n=1 Tax=Streptomyces sp. NBC_00140 TaxID=2975664 RepID=UPI00224CAC82|nr:helicase-related protein [Streptomyces sp. NBC_00140]MCX5333808.1 helicase-related protein [Streptomyces sp. NBC_00140]
MTGEGARGIVEAAVRRELFGPEPGGKPLGAPIDCSGPRYRFATKEEGNGQFHDRDTLEEVLTRSDPLRRYGVGVLFSGGSAGGTAVDENPLVIDGAPQSEESPDQPPVEVKGHVARDEVDSDDFDLSDANRRKPSAMAISFKVRVPSDGSLGVRVTGAYYDRVVVTIPGVSDHLDWWVRRPFELDATVSGGTLLNEVQRVKVVPTAPSVSEPKIAPAKVPTLSVFSRMVPGESDADLRLVTLAVTNEVPGTGPGSAFFQMGFKATAQGGLRIEPYPDVEQPDSDEEEESIALLYRERLTYAIGHGCAAAWEESDPLTWVEADAMPAYEVASLTPDVYEVHQDGSRTPVSVSMAELAEQTPEGDAQVEKVLRLYREWIEGREASIHDLDKRFHPAALRHMRLCRGALKRMEEGWQLVLHDPLAARAFQLANFAMLYQQVRSRLDTREVVKDAQDVYRPVGAHPDAAPGPRDGRWRAFQIAFVLASLPELVDPTHAKRSVVDLIFFPTGGGKTEAYLGASAISLIARRLRNPADAGTDTLMRYTLRLLTAQQFLRASSLICVLEDMRSKNEEELGKALFGIGVWLGGDSTPNTWKSAESSLKKLRSDSTAPNRFLLLKCPWCGTRMGPVRRAKKGQDTPGYVWSGNRFVLKCIDELCRFSGREGLPVHVVDDDIYDSRPSIVIGTVDKFATMAWRPKARNLFGLGEDGERLYSPPGVIIQDELHLISGPLGSMVGLYEPVIDDLATDRRGGKPIPAKIIASTATVRRYEDQIKGLFGRTEVALFPPHGLTEGHSFFAEPATLEDGTPAPGRRYLGVMSASLGSTQTVQVRVAAATLQAGPQIPDQADRDGYWTNLNFLNSLRELGNTVSLLQSDVPDYLVGLQRRDSITPRWPRNAMELTSRRRSDEIPKAIEQLQRTLPSPDCIDICLASNIIEVGVDVSRLGLMTIVGQPKTTAQYIQVSGRVGRDPRAPGLVITIYGAAKPRDRSHYERFRTYHQQLYAQVEPTSVTPFAEPVLKRALHAAAISHMRQLDPGLEPYPFPKAEYDAAVALLRQRAELVDPEEVAIFDHWAVERARQWDLGERTAWAASMFFDGDPKQGLMRPAGELADPDNKTITWDTPLSMRNVDAECRLEITRAYVKDDLAGEDREV